VDCKIESFVFIAYLLAGPGAWGVFWFAMMKGRSWLSIRIKPAPAIERFPPVSVVLPARNEVDHIEACCESLLRQDYPHLEIIVVNDRSTDGTGDVLDAIAAREPRLRVIHVGENDLPESWFGKTYAMHLGSQRAAGEWLVFTDSDCRLAPSAVREGVVTGESRRFDLVSFVPKFETRGFWDGLMTPLGGIATNALYAVIYANASQVPKVAFACGQFLAVRKSVYDRVGGWSAVRHLPSDDVEMARLLKRNGFRPRLGWGMDLVTAHMYSSGAEVWRGWARNFIIASRGKPGRVLGGAAFVVACVLSIYAAIAWGAWMHNWLWITAAAVHGVAITSAMVSAYRWGRYRVTYALLWPIGSMMLLAIFARSLYLCAIGRVDWRGATYSLRMKSQTT